MSSKADGWDNWNVPEKGKTCSCQTGFTSDQEDLTSNLLAMRVFCYHGPMMAYRCSVQQVEVGVQMVPERTS